MKIFLIIVGALAVIRLLMWILSKLGKKSGIGGPPSDYTNNNDSGPYIF